MGPVNQVKKMFASTRIIATLVVLFCIAMTLVSAIGVSDINFLKFESPTEVQLSHYFLINPLY